MDTPFDWVEKFEGVATSMGLSLDKVVCDSYSPLYKSHITRECWKNWQIARSIVKERDSV